MAEINMQFRCLLESNTHIHTMVKKKQTRHHTRDDDHHDDYRTSTKNDHMYNMTKISVQQGEKKSLEVRIETTDAFAIAQ